MVQRVRFEVTEEQVGIVTLDRPEKLNAMDTATFEGLHEAARRCAAGAEGGTVRAVLLIGAGRAFSAGLDVALFGEQVAEPPGEEWIAWLQRAFTAFEDLPVPTVAALHGVAIGAGLQLALACHLRVAAPETTLGLLEARWGLLPDLGATWRLPRLVGLGRATDLAVSGRTITAAQAHEWGAVGALLDGGDFAAEALAYATRLARGPSVASGAVTRLLREHLLAARDDALAAERRAQLACLASEDFREVVTAATEGREPVFRGH